MFVPLLVIGLLGAALMAQQPAPSLSGTVISGRDGAPVNRAEVILRSSAAGATPLGVTTDQKGRFAFYNVKPGWYNLYAMRDGSLPSTYVLYRDVRMPRPFAVSDREPLNGLVLRLPPAAVLSGKVRHDDGEPASGVVVEAYRGHYERSRFLYETAGRTITNDRGEYRMYNLPSGKYYISAIVRTFRGSETIVESLPADFTGTRIPAQRSVTTFFPSAWKLTEAASFTLSPGAEIPHMDITLARTRSAIVVGRAISSLSGRLVRGATIELHRPDADQLGYLPARFETKPLQDGTFEIHGVVPGTYYIEASASEEKKALRVRQLLVVTENPEEKLELLLRPEVTLAGAVRVANQEQVKLNAIQFKFEPRTDAPVKTAAVNSDGEFQVSLLPGIEYRLTMSDAPDNVYMAGARLNSADVLRDGLSLIQSASAPLDITVSPAGGQIRGVSQPGANILLMPDNGRLEDYQSTAAGDYGVFHFRGVAPGDYRLLSWFDTPPCSVHDRAARGVCSAFGAKVSVAESATQLIEVQPTDNIDARPTSGQ